METSKNMTPELLRALSCSGGAETLAELEDAVAESSLFQRILLLTDGTVTKVLEQYAEEPMSVFKLYENVENRINKLPEQHRSILNTGHMPVLHREILLQGRSTSKNWVYAESSLLLGRLSSGFRNDLLNLREPIGKLWAKHRVETFKTILETGREAAGELAGHFNIGPDDQLLTRTYSVHSGGKLTMLITEKFPDSFFLD